MLEDSKLTLTEVFAIIGLILLIIIAFGSCCLKNSNKRVVTVEVTDKGIKTKGNDSKYLIYTKDAAGEIMVFEITDSLVYQRFDSSDVYAGIEIGKTYDFTIVGIRFPFFSMYPNIINYQEVEADG